VKSHHLPRQALDAAALYRKVDQWRIYYSAGDITVDEVSGHPSIDLSSLEGDIELLLPSDAFRSEKRNETKRNGTPSLSLSLLRFSFHSQLRSL
jgi:hypothetical protein